MTYKKFKSLWNKALGDRNIKNGNSPHLTKALIESAEGNSKTFDKAAREIKERDNREK